MRLIDDLNSVPLSDWEYEIDDTENRRKAEAEGFELVYGTNMTLQLDLDTPAADATFRREFARFREKGQLQAVKLETWISKSGNNHVIITLLKPKSMLERIVLQAGLGSDPIRELMNYRRWDHSLPDPICLFRPPGAVVHTTILEAVNSDDRAEADEGFWT